MKEQSGNKMNLLDLAAFVGRWRLFLFVSVTSVAALVAGISYLITPKYRSTAIVRPAQSSSSNIGSLLGSKLAMLGGIYTGVGALMNGAPGRELVSLLKSRNFIERLIDQFDLQVVYGMQGAPIEDVIETFEANSRLEMDIVSSDVIISVDDERPTRAKAMADFCVEELDRRNRSLKSNQATKEKEFISQRLSEAQSVLAALEDSVTAFQMRTGLISIEEQVKATISASAVLESQRLALLSELELKQQIFAPGSPEISYLQMQLESINRSIRGTIMESSEESNDLLLRINEVPKEAKTFLRLMRDIEIQQLLTAYLLQQYEQSKIDELRNTPTLIVLDPPALPTRKIWPRRGLMVVLAAMGTLIFSSVIAVMIDFLRRSSRDPSHESHARLITLRQSWAREKSPQ